MVSLKKNLIYSVAYQILVIFLPLITAPYVSRVLGAGGIGEYSFTQSVAYYYILMAMLGIAQQGNRAIAEAGNDVRRRSEYFINIYVIQIVTHVAAISVYLLYLMFSIGDSSVLPWIQLIYLVSSLFDISWLFFGMEKFDITVTCNTVIKILTAILVFVVVKQEKDLWKYTLILVGGTFLSQIYLWRYFRKYVKFVKPRWSEIKRQIKPILVMFVPVLAYSIYKVMDKIMLGNMTNYIQVGYYENAYKINNIPIGLITAVGNVMLPRMTAVASKGERNIEKQYIRCSFSVMNVLATAMVCGIVGVSNNFVYIYYGAEYTPCVKLIVYLNWAVFFIAWANIMRTQYLIPKKKDKAYVKSTLAGALINLVLNFMFIGSLQAMGAVIGTLVAEFTVMFIQLICIRKEVPVCKYIMQSLPYYLVGGIMIVIVRIIGYYMPIGIITLMIQITAGGGFFLICMVLIAVKRKDDIYQLIFHPLVEKMK